MRALVERFHTRGRAYMDLSVMHDNTPAIRLYEKLGVSDRAAAVAEGMRRGLVE